MDSMINIGGGRVYKEDVENLESLLVALLTTISDKKIDREVAIEALKTLSSVIEVKNVTISNSNFTCNPNTDVLKDE